MLLFVLNVAARALQATGQPLTGVERDRLRALYGAHHQVVWRVLRRSGLDEPHADDGAQQVFLVALKRLTELDPERERAFLCGTAVMVARKMRQTGGRESLPGVLPEAESSDRPDVATEHRRNLVLLDTLLRQLDDELRAVFVLQEVEGLSKREAAEALGLPQGTVASRLRRARAEFDALLKAATEGRHG